MAMAARWNRYFKEQQKDPKMKDLVENELAIILFGKPTKIEGHTRAATTSVVCQTNRVNARRQIAPEASAHWRCSKT
jgi:hypothetical protein